MVQTMKKSVYLDFRMSFIKIVSVIIIMLSWKENQWYGGENLLSTSESIPEIGKRPQIGWSGSCNRFIASSLCKKTILMKDTLCCNIALTRRKIHFNVFFYTKSDGLKLIARIKYLEDSEVEMGDVSCHMHSCFYTTCPSSK